MQVTIDTTRGFEILDELLCLWKSKAYPYTRHDAILPQTTIPAVIRRDEYALACFYFYICIYMRGGIESLQVFSAFYKMHEQYPDLFNPAFAQFYRKDEVQTVLKAFIGWDSKTAANNWVENSRLLMSSWNGDPRALVKGVKTFDEACRRIRNKRTKSDLKRAGENGHGFVGFQHKMVSMLLYFYDWEGWLKPRFLYPSPADFHNFRLGFATGIISVEGLAGRLLTINDRISQPWRDLVLTYLIERRADPVMFADALWLYSLVMCGNSPVTRTSIREPLPLFLHNAVEDDAGNGCGAAIRSIDVSQSCLVCQFESRCTMAIPAQPYYRKGKFELRPRARLERTLSTKPKVVQTNDATDSSQHMFQIL